MNATSGKAEFLTSLEVTKLRDLGDEKHGRSRWELGADLVFYSAILQRTVTAQAGSQSDFASVPRLPLSYLLAGNTAHASAAIHDHLYRTVPHICTRRQADLVFLEAMKVEGVPLWRRELMYAAVRVGGFRSWR